MQENRTSVKVLVYAFSSPDVCAFRKDFPLSSSMDMRKEKAGMVNNTKQFYWFFLIQAKKTQLMCTEEVIQLNPN